MLVAHPLATPLFAATDLYVGGIVSVVVRIGLLTFVHKGIVSDRIGPDDFPMIIHRSKHFGVVAETTATDFGCGRVGPISFEGFYPTRLTSEQIVERARSKINHRWGLWQNCEHFVSEAQGLMPFSPQLQSGLGKLALAAIAGFAVHRIANGNSRNHDDE